MSINITKSSDSKKSTTPVNVVPDFVQPRDERGRFASSEVTNLDSAPKEVKQLKSLYMNEVEWTAPYIYNFVKDNGAVRALIDDGDLRGCLYLNKDTESYYLFFTLHSSFGFHLSCGILAEVLNNEDTVKLSTEHDILYWDAIQKV